MEFFTILGVGISLVFVLLAVMFVCEIVEATHEAVDLIAWRIANARMAGKWNDLRRSPRFWFKDFPRHAWVAWVDCLGTSPGYSKFSASHGWWVGAGNWILSDREKGIFIKGPNYNTDVPVLN